MSWNIEIKINIIKVSRIHYNILHYRNSNLKIFGIVVILSKAYCIFCYRLGYKHNFSQLALEGMLLKITDIFLIWVLCW